MDIGNIDPAAFYSLDGPSLGQFLVKWNIDETIVSTLLSIYYILYIWYRFTEYFFLIDQGIDGGTFLDLDRRTNQDMGLNIGQSLKVEKLILAIKSRFQLCGSPSKVSAPSQSKQINQGQQQKNNYAASLVYEEGYSSMDSYSTSSYASSMSNSESNQAEYNVLDLDSQPQTILRDSGITLHMSSDSPTMLPSDPAHHHHHMPSDSSTVNASTSKERTLTGITIAPLYWFTISFVV